MVTQQRQGSDFDTMPVRIDQHRRATLRLCDLGLDHAFPRDDPVQASRVVHERPLVIFITRMMVWRESKLGGWTGRGYHHRLLASKNISHRIRESHPRGILAAAIDGNKSDVAQEDFRSDSVTRFVVRNAGDIEVLVAQPLKLIVVVQWRARRC
jgi:hypothetical protein